MRSGPVLISLLIAMAAPAALAQDPAPASDDPAIAQPVLVCTGTEPFWKFTLGIDAARLEPMSGPPMTVSGLATGMRTGRVGHGFRADDGSGLVAAAIETGQCSDGMSDILYPYDISISLPEDVWYQGCCWRADEPRPRPE